MKTRGKIDSSEKPKQQLYVFLEKVTFCLENVMFYSSSKSCNEKVSAYSRVSWIYLLFLVMLILQVESLGSRLIAKIGL